MHHTTPDGRPLFPVAVLIFVVRDGRILLGKRGEGYGKGTWGLPGGHLEFGESLEDAARRELKEETGLRAKSLTFKNIVNRKSGDSHYIHIGFLAEADGEPELCEPEACSEWGWFPLDTLPQPMFPWSMGPIQALQDGQVLVDATEVTS